MSRNAFQIAGSYAGQFASRVQQGSLFNLFARFFEPLPQTIDKSGTIKLRDTNNSYDIGYNLIPDVANYKFPEYEAAINRNPIFYGDEEITNGEFIFVDADLPEWTKILPVTLTEEFTDLPSGVSNAVRIQAGSNDGIQQNTSLKPSTTYLSEFWYKVVAGRLSYRIYSPTGGYELQVATETSTWTKDSRLVTMSANLDSDDRVIFWAGLADSNILIADYKMKEVIPAFNDLGVANSIDLGDVYEVDYGSVIRDETSILDLKINKQTYYPNYIKRSGDDLYIISKFDSSNDLLCRFQKCMFNDLYTFQRVGIIARSGLDYDIDNIEEIPTTIFVESGGDNIGPVSIVGEGWIGGNHSHDNDYVTKTAICNSFTITADGQTINDGDTKYCKNIVVMVANTLYDPSLLPSTQDGLITETVVYKIAGQSIEVEVTHEYLKNLDIGVYYGMQGIYSNVFDNIFFGHSQYSDVVAYDTVTEPDSGTFDTYPNVEKIVQVNTAKTIGQSLLLNTDFGLGIARPINAGDTTAFTGNGKAYFRLIDGKSFTQGQFEQWQGTYTWFNPTEQTIDANTLFIYGSRLGNIPVLCADFKGAAVQGFTHEDFDTKQLEIKEGDSGISVDYNDGIEVTSTGIGAIQLKTK